MQMSDLFSLIGLGGVAIGLFLNVWAVIRGNAQKRAEFVINLYSQLTNDEIAKFYERLEWDEITEIKDKSADAKVLDKLLALFDNIGHLKRTGNFYKKDMQYFALEMILLYENQAVRDYINRVKNYYQNEKKYSEKIIPFTDFEEIAKNISKKYKLK